MSLPAKQDPRDITLGNFRLEATGIMQLGEATFEEWLGVGQFLQRVEGATQWWIGDWLLYGEGRPEWGDKYEQAIEMFDREYSTNANYKWVARAFKFSDRTEKLPWTHHQVVAGVDDLELRAELLAEAEPEEGSTDPRLSVAELRDRVRQHKREEIRRENPLPVDQYRVIYADPPWKYNDERTGTIAAGAASAHYMLLDTQDICELYDAEGRTVSQLALPDAVLFLWATSPLLPDALEVITAWGFTYKASFVWNKVRSYNGHYNAVQHELLLVATRGSCLPDKAGLVDSIVTIERTAHSRKPDDFYELIEELYTEGPYLELFARREREGWDSWGNEAKAGAA